ncbi:hypothetical protein [Acinetobacter chinensis]|uniref:hypothetical protein n=1 Tax=Acinetobacter chinensis TaxID=2004650 RepID=UPI002934B0E2|nr:hypothetical protein [Acinetobacter chinensis]WOE40061.1 hypothetical protein QSG87_09055 [Acinetobacter chinensis]
MSYLIFKKQGAKVGDSEVAIQCTSAIFNYQVIGAGAVVQFSGSNKPDADETNEDHWQEIVTITAGQPDTEPFRQHAWDKLRYKVIEGDNIEIYVSSGVSG